MVVCGLDKINAYNFFRFSMYYYQYTRIQHGYINTNQTVVPALQHKIYNIWQK